MGHSAQRCVACTSPSSILRLRLCIPEGAAADAIAAAEALQRGDWGTAWRHARTAAAGCAASPDILAVRGVALARLGCLDDAEACLRDALVQACC